MIFLIQYASSEEDNSSNVDTQCSFDHDIISLPSPCEQFINQLALFSNTDQGYVTIEEASAIVEKVIQQKCQALKSVKNEAQLIEVHKFICKLISFASKFEKLFQIIIKSQTYQSLLNCIKPEETAFLQKALRTMFLLVSSIEFSPQQCTRYFQTIPFNVMKIITIVQDLKILSFQPAEFDLNALLVRCVKCQIKLFQIMLQHKFRQFSREEIIAIQSFISFILQMDEVTLTFYFKDRLIDGFNRYLMNISNLKQIFDKYRLIQYLKVIQPYKNKFYVLFKYSVIVYAKDSELISTFYDILEEELKNQCRTYRKIILFCLAYSCNKNKHAVQKLLQHESLVETIFRPIKNDNFITRLYRFFSIGQISQGISDLHHESSLFKKIVDFNFAKTFVPSLDSKSSVKRKAASDFIFYFYIRRDSVGLKKDEIDFEIGEVDLESAKIDLDIIIWRQISEEGNIQETMKKVWKNVKITYAKTKSPQDQNEEQMIK